MKVTLYAVLFCFVASAGKAQNKINNQYSFHSVNTISVVNGSNGAAAAVQTVNGFAKENWFAGIGAGIDYYQYRSVPVFADIRYELGKKKNRFFVYTDAGINCSWVTDEYKQWSSNLVNDYSNGLYTDAGAGLNAYFKNGNAVVLSVGYSRKVIKETIIRQTWNTGTERTVTDINNYKFNRLVLKLGFRF